MATKHEIELAEAQTAYYGLLGKKVEAETEEIAGKVADWKEGHRNQVASLDKHRIYRFYESVSPGSAESAIEQLDFWSRRDVGEDIVIEFNSPGGSVLHGLALYDFIQELRRRGHHVTTIARGMAASMGGVLLQAGNKRVCDENAHILIHEISSLGIGKLSEIEDEVKFMKLLWEQRLASILAARSTMSRGQIVTKARRKDWWFGADEALKLGFVDRIDTAPPFAA